MCLCASHYNFLNSFTQTHFLSLHHKTSLIMKENKTKQTDINVGDYLDSIEDPKRKNDCIIVAGIMKEITGEEPKMWGDSIVGFGSYHYKYASGREGDWFITGFSSRKQNLSIYLHYGFEEEKKLMEKLGKYKTGKACLYIKKIEDISQEVLKELIEKSIEKSRELD